jgi:hypothetical protein
VYNNGGFTRRSSLSETSNLNLIGGMLSLAGELNAEDQERLYKIRDYWNFYEGFHWEDIPPDDKPQITENHCRKFVNRYVAFEMGSAFTINVPVEQDEVDSNSPTPIADFLNDVWDDNNKDQLCIDIGQMKSITGDSWVQVKYESPTVLDDPFEEYPNGRIRLIVMPTSVIFPVYDPHDKDKLLAVSIMYPIEVVNKTPILRREMTK